MNYDEYIAELNTLTDEFNQKRKELIRKYVDENNPYKTGDKVTDHIGTIVIEKISYSVGLYGKPEAKYYGLVLKKDGTPKKITERRCVFQSNIL